MLKKKHGERALLYCIGYVSTAVVTITQRSLIELVKAACRNNEAHYITGLLIYKDGKFLQFMEGEEKDVTRLYEKIKQDPRHRGIITIYHHPIDLRVFARWGLALEDPTLLGPEDQSLYVDIANLQSNQPHHPGDHIEKVKMLIKSLFNKHAA